MSEMSKDEDKNKLLVNKTKLNSNELAELIVDSLVDTELLKKEDIQKAIITVAEEIDIRKSLGDY